ncbi:MAG: septum formation initiator family protein [Bariatricus sp.]|nr:septum formation initiator family protein [Bariatricus sp.]
MGSLKQKGRKRRPKSRLQSHKRSVLAISGIIIMLSAVIVIHGMTLQSRNKEYMAQEAELMAQLEDEQERSEEIDELKDYVGTDEYIEDVAKEKLGLIKQNEILFKSAE